VDDPLHQAEIAVSEEVESKRGDERPQWLDVAVTILPPLSLITALLVYFGWARRVAYAAELGFDVGLLEEASIPGYLIRSVGTVFIPLLVATVGLLLWLGVDRMLRRWARDRVHLLAISRASWVLPVSGALLVLVALLVKAASPVAQPYVSLALPFLLALVVLATTYGASLRRLADRKPSDGDDASRRWATNALIGLLVSLLLFWGVDGFAQVVGRGLGERINEQPYRYTQPVLLYSRQDLHLDPATATHQELPGEEHSAYRNRYEGLRLVFVNGDQYFLIDRNWRPRGGTLIVLPRDGIRIEFPRGSV